MCARFVFSILYGIKIWVTTIDIYSRVTCKQVFWLLALRVKSFGYYMLFLPLLAAVFITVTNHLGMSSFPWIGVFSLFLLQIYVYEYQATPPTVIHLGSSCSATALLRYRIDRGINPYRVIVLFDPSIEFNSAEYYQNSLEWDNYRTNQDWKPVAHALMEMAPRVVIDTRVPSPGVVHEVSRVCSDMNLIRKTFFVISDNGEAPALVYAGIHLNPTIKAVREVDLIMALRNSGLTKVRSVDDHPWMKNMMGDDR
jgi:hypothetical protein